MSGKYLGRSHVINIVSDRRIIYRWVLSVPISSLFSQKSLLWEFVLWSCILKRILNHLRSSKMKHMFVLSYQKWSEFDGRTHLGSPSDFGLRKFTYLDHTRQLIKPYRSPICVCTLILRVSRHVQIVPPQKSVNKSMSNLFVTVFVHVIKSRFVHCGTGKSNDTFVENETKKTDDRVSCKMDVEKHICSVSEL